MAAILILNSIAGTEAAPDYVAHVLTAHSPRPGVIDVAITAQAGDASRELGEVVTAGCEQVIVAGGDDLLPGACGCSRHNERNA